MAIDRGTSGRLRHNGASAESEKQDVSEKSTRNGRGNKVFQYRRCRLAIPTSCPNRRSGPDPSTAG
ncbi:hypothetical protein RRSWK_01525 [Rhodopirellula sp. SWK7]|nr:hypothetical protein RRSWK_01525 [Rhodopirellula sp. SWK7]